MPQSMKLGASPLYTIHCCQSTCDRCLAKDCARCGTKGAERNHGLRVWGVQMVRTQKTPGFWDSVFGFGGVYICPPAWDSYLEESVLISSATLSCLVDVVARLTKLQCPAILLKPQNFNERDVSITCVCRVLLNFACVFLMFCTELCV